MIEQLKNIETAFKHVRLFTAVVVLAAFGSQCYLFYYCLNRIDRERERLFVIVNGKAVEAFASTVKENVPVEARDHVQSFHNYFFNLSPDDKAIQQNIVKALYLADGSAKDQYDDLREKGYYSNVISANVSQEVACDSISLHTLDYPYYFKYYGKVKIIRTSAILTRSLITEGYLRRVDRSDHNSHGFLIEKWNILENKDVSNEKR